MAIDAAQLTIDLQEKDRWRRTINVTVPADLVEEERKKAAAKLAKRLKMPGFRSGKIPPSVVEQRYGDALRQETLDRIINDAYKEALQQQSIRPISEGELEDVQYEPESDLRFAISFDVQPEIELSRLGDFAVERPSAEVDEEDVERVLQRLREQNGSWRPEEGTPEAGDLVQVSIVQLDDEAEGGEDGEEEPREYEFELGEDQALPDIETALLTMETGEEREITVTFPEDSGNEELRGEQRRLRLALLGRKVQDLPELTDELARSVGDFETVEDLTETIRTDIRRESEQEAEQAVRGRLLDLILDANAFEVPRTLVDGYLEQILDNGQDLSDEERAEASASLRPQAERAVKRALVIEEVAKTQGLRATEDEVDERVAEIAERNDTSPSQVYARLQKAGRLSSLEREITEEKVFEFLKAKSKITNAESRERS